MVTSRTLRQSTSYYSRYCDNLNDGQSLTACLQVNKDNATASLSGVWATESDMRLKMDSVDSAKNLQSFS